MIAAWVLQNHPLGYRGNSPDCLYGVAFSHFATAKASVFEGGGLKTLFFTNLFVRGRKAGKELGKADDFPFGIMDEWSDDNDLTK
jgi:hypothetical protein